MGKRWVPDEDYYDPDQEALLGVFATSNDACHWIKNHTSPEGIYRGKDIQGKVVLVDNVSCCCDVEGHIGDDPEPVIRTLVIGTALDW